MLFSSTCQLVGVFFWKHFRSDMFFLLVKCHWQVLTWKLKLAVSNLSYCICKQLMFPSEFRGKEVKPDSRQGFLTNLPTCMHNAPFQKKKSLPLHLIRSISLSAQRIPSVHSFYQLHVLYLATLNLTVWQHSSTHLLSTHQGDEWFSIMRICLLRNPCAHAVKFLGIIHLMMNDI